MARDESGKFLPGESPNPGGRPGTAMAQTLSGRRSKRALAELLAVLGPGLTVVVVDARGLVLADGPARRAGLDLPGAGDLDRLGDDLGGAAPDPAEIVAARARVDANRRATEQLISEGWREVGEDVPSSDPESRATWRRVEWHGPAGEVLRPFGWFDLVAERARLLLDAAPPAPFDQS